MTTGPATIKHGVLITTSQTVSGILNWYMPDYQWAAMNTLLIAYRYPGQPTTSGELNRTQAVAWADAILHLTAIVYKDSRPTNPTPKRAEQRIFKANVDAWSMMAQRICQVKPNLTYRPHIVR